MRKTYLFTVSLAMGAFMALPAMAKSPMVAGGDISVKPDAKMQNATLTVSGPNGFHDKAEAGTGVPSLSLMKNGQLADGVYSWELTGHTNERVYSYKTGINNGRGENARDFSYKQISQSGSFYIVNGQQVRAEDAGLEEPAAQNKRFETPNTHFDHR